MAIRRKPMLRMGTQRSAHSGVSRGELMKANLKRFHELIQRSQGVESTASTPPAPAPQPEQAAASTRAPVGEVISPPRDGNSGVSGVRMARAARQVCASVLGARDQLREEAGQFLASHHGIEHIVAEAQRIAELATSTVQRTGEIAEVTTVEALYDAQRQKMEAQRQKMRQQAAPAASPNKEVSPPAIPA